MTNHAESPFNAHQDSPELSSVAVSQPGSQDKQADDSDSGSNTQDCTTPKHEVKPVDLKLCSNVKYDKRMECMVSATVLKMVITVGPQ